MSKWFAVQRWCYYRLWFPVWSVVMNVRQFVPFPADWFASGGMMRRAKNDLLDAYKFAEQNTVLGEPLRWALVTTVKQVEYDDDTAHDWQKWPRNTLLSGVGDCEDFAALNVWAMGVLGIRAKVVRLFGPGAPAHSVAVSKDLHWLVDQYRTTDLWDLAAKTGETHLQTVLLGIYTINGKRKYTEIWQ